MFLTHMRRRFVALPFLIRAKGKRQWVKHRKINAEKPMEYLCLDIKYLWIHGEKRYYFLLTILDVFTRKVFRWLLQKSICKIDVINLFREINLEHGIKGVNIRNDNGSQFIANDVRQFLRAAEAYKEFTHVATPEENAYIEAYHSILETEVVQQFEFDGFYEAKLTITAYVDFYNNRRIHGGIGYLSKSFTFYWKKSNKEYDTRLKHLRSTYITASEIYSFRQGPKLKQHANARITDKHYNDQKEIAKFISKNRSKNRFIVFPK